MNRQISATFTWSSEDYQASTRGVGMFRILSYDSLINRAGLLIFGHLFPASGILVTAMAISGVEGKNGPIPTIAIVTSLVVSTFAKIVLFHKWYGRRHVANRAFQASQLPNLKTTVLFGPNDIETTNHLIQPRRSWIAFTQVLEYRDAFLIVSGVTADWLPKYAFVEPFDDVSFAESERSPL
ncbi:hypothetical protein ACYOEI_05540 [Singulisphaera rosea]